MTGSGPSAEQSSTGRTPAGHNSTGRTPAEFGVTGAAPAVGATGSVPALGAVVGNAAVAVVPSTFAAVVLAGGAGRRMGGVDKPALPVGGTPMRDRVLAAVVDAAPRIVVGAAGDLPAGVHGTREQPPGGGPVAATAAGLSLIADPAPADRVESAVALLAADLPLLTAEAVHDLRAALARAASVDGAVYVDDTGRAQWLCGIWRLSALRAALARLAARHDGDLGGTSMRALMRELTVAEVAWHGVGPPPWFDCDTENDVRRAEEWIR